MVTLIARWQHTQGNRNTRFGCDRNRNRQPWFQSRVLPCRFYCRQAIWRQWQKVCRPIAVRRCNGLVSAAAGDMSPSRCSLCCSTPCGWRHRDWNRGRRPWTWRCRVAGRRHSVCSGTAPALVVSCDLDRILNDNVWMGLSLFLNPAIHSHLVI